MNKFLLIARFIEGSPSSKVIKQGVLKSKENYSFVFQALVFVVELDPSGKIFQFF